jgi:hypothetical protein
MQQQFEHMCLRRADWVKQQSDEPGRFRIKNSACDAAQLARPYHHQTQKRRLAVEHRIREIDIHLILLLSSGFG